MSDEKQLTQPPTFGPPWVLFILEGMPRAILPACRPGEVANVAHLSMAEADLVVALVNGEPSSARDAFRRIILADNCSLCGGMNGAHAIRCLLRGVVPASVTQRSRNDG